MSMMWQIIFLRMNTYNPLLTIGAIFHASRIIAVIPTISWKLIHRYCQTFQNENCRAFFKSVALGFLNGGTIWSRLMFWVWFRGG